MAKDNPQTQRPSEQGVCGKSLSHLNNTSSVYLLRKQGLTAHPTLGDQAGLKIKRPIRFC